MLSRMSHVQRLGALAVAGFVAAIAIACVSSGADDAPAGEVRTDAYQADTDSGLAGAPRPHDQPAVGGGGAETSSGDGSSPQTIGTTLDRKIVMTATLTMEAEEVLRRYEDIGNLAASYGGFIASSSLGNDSEQQSASLTIRIPADRYQNALIDLRKMGDVKGEQSSAGDVTEEYTDLQSRLRNLRATETQLLELMNRAATIDEILTVTDRLNINRGEIEQVQGRINLLDNQADLATITVHLSTPVAGKPVVDDGKTTPLEALENGWEASLDVLTAIAAATLAVVAFSWWLVPVVAVGGWLVRRFARPSNARRAELPPATTA